MVLFFVDVYAEGLDEGKEMAKFNPPGGGKGVEVSYFGQSFKPMLKLYTKKVGIDKVDKVDKVDKAYIDFVNKLISNYIANDKSKYLSVWNEKERKPKAKKLTSDVLIRSKNIALNIQDIKLAKVVIYGEYRLLYAMHTYSSGDKSMITYVVTKNNNEYFLSNMLVDDPFFNYIAPLLDKRNQ